MHPDNCNNAMERRRLFLFHVFVSLANLAVPAAAVTAPACTRDCLCTSESDDAGSLSACDSLSICFSAPGGIRTLDLLLYRDTLTMPLESHTRIQFDNTNGNRLLSVASRAGDRLLAAIANSPAPLNLAALQHFASAEYLEMYYSEEDPDYPLMSAVELFNDRSVEVTLKPLLCRLDILGINNRSGLLLEKPRLRLEGVNSHVQMLRSDGFSTIETVDSPASLAHPEIMQYDIGCDIGLEPWTEGASLWCYPFDGEGPSGTSIVLSALAGGEPREWNFKIASLTRGEISQFLLNLYDLAICEAPVSEYASAAAAHSGTCVRPFWHPGRE